MNRIRVISQPDSEKLLPTSPSGRTHCASGGGFCVGVSKRNGQAMLSGVADESNADLADVNRILIWCQTQSKFGNIVYNT